MGVRKKKLWPISFHSSVLIPQLQGAGGRVTSSASHSLSSSQVLLVGGRFCPWFIWFEAYPEEPYVTQSPLPYLGWLWGACTAPRKPVTVKRHSRNPSILPAARYVPCCSTGYKYFNHCTDLQHQWSKLGRKLMKCDGFIYPSNIRETNTHAQPSFSKYLLGD